MNTPAPPPVGVSRNYRCTFTLPVPLATGIARIAKRIGISQSALLAQLLEEPIADLVALVQSIPEDPTPGDVLRARGQSVDLIEQRVHEVLAAAAQLKADA